MDVSSRGESLASLRIGGFRIGERNGDGNGSLDWARRRHGLLNQVPLFRSMGHRASQEDETLLLRLTVTANCGKQFSVRKMVTKSKLQWMINIEDFCAEWEEAFDTADELSTRTLAVQITISRDRGRNLLSELLPFVEVFRNTLKLDYHTIGCGPVQQTMLMENMIEPDSVLRIHFEAKFDERRVVELRMSNPRVDLAASAAEPSGSDGIRLCSSFSTQSFRQYSPVSHMVASSAHWESLTPLRFDASLKGLMYGSLLLDVLDAGTDRKLATASIRVRDHVQITWGRMASLKMDLINASQQRCGVISVCVQLRNAPRFCQLRGGIHSETGVFDGRPLACGMCLPHGNTTHSTFHVMNDSSVHGSSAEHSLSWMQLVDVFGNVLFYNRHAQLWSVLPPDDPDFRPFGVGNKSSTALFIDDRTGFETWMHHRMRRLGESAEVQDTERNEISVPPRGGVQVASRTSSTSATMSRRNTAAQEQMPRDTIADSAPLPTPALVDKPYRSSVKKRDVWLPTENVAGENGRSHPENREMIFGDGLGKESGLTEMKWTSLLAATGRQSMCPVAVEGHTLLPVLDGKQLLHFGGRGRNAWTNAVHMLDSEANVWTPISPSGPRPAARTGHGAAVLAGGTRMLVYGGASKCGRLNDMFVLNVDTHQWIPVIPSTLVVPSRCARMTFNAIDNGSKAILFGGREGFRLLGDRYLNDIYLFDASRLEWLRIKPKGSVGPEPRAGHIAQVINGRQLMVFGGWEDSVKYYNSTWLFDLVSNTWQKPPYPQSDLPSARESHASALFDEKVVVFGGQNEMGASLNDLHVFDSSSLQWLREKVVTGESPQPRSGACIAPVQGDRMVVCGGDTGFYYTATTYSLEMTHRSEARLKVVQDNARLRRDAGDLCAICLDARVEVAFLWCGHSCTCRPCGARVRTCPWCRAYISRMEMIELREQVSVTTSPANTSVKDRSRDVPVWSTAS